MRTYVTGQDDMVDAFARLHYGSEHGGTTEAILAANPGLAAQGPKLPAGLSLNIPDLPAPGPNQLATVDLWA